MSYEDDLWEAELKEIDEYIESISDDYDRYRDDWCDALHDALTKVFVDFVKDKNGYYFDANEKFLTHAVRDLQSITGCEVTANFGRVKVDKPLIEFVNSYEEVNEVLK